jgi:hypothetical protein
MAGEERAVMSGKPGTFRIPRLILVTIPRSRVRDGSAYALETKPYWVARLRWGVGQFPRRTLIPPIRIHT